MRCRFSRLYETYETMPDVITRVLNGLYEIGHLTSVNTILRKFGIVNVGDYETRGKEGIDMSIKRQLAMDLWYSPRLPLYDLSRVLLYFATTEIFHKEFDDELLEFNREYGIIGGTLGDFTLPHILRSPYWPEHVQSPMTYADLECLASFLDERTTFIPLY